MIRKTMLVVVLFIGIAVWAQAQADNQNLSGYTTDIVNLRRGPGTGFEVVRVLPYQTSLLFTGRNQSGTWLKVSVDDVEGWLSYTFVRVDGSVNILPVIGSDGAQSPPSGGSNAAPPSTTLPGSVVPQISQTSRRIFQRGQSLGNSRDVFSKVGDSITASNLFLDPIGNGAYNLYDYEYLRPVISFFSRTSLRDHFSFANTSLAARGGWTTFDVLDPRRSVAGLCNTDESPLVCEYRVNRPAVALIMLGTNDAAIVTSAEFRDNMSRIVQTSIDMGVIPVISTIPDQPNTAQAGRVREFNDIIREIARTYDVPLWDYWLALQGLPNLGVSSDNIHPSYDFATSATAYFSPTDLRYGYNVRNLTALMVLHAIWQEVLEE